MNWYKKASVDDKYSTMVKVSLYGGPVESDIYAVSPVRVPFDISIEAREWGIKDISIVVSGEVEVHCEVIRGENEDQVDKAILTVDMGQLSKDIYSDRKLYTLGDMSLWVNEDMSIDYGRSSIEVFTY